MAEVPPPREPISGSGGIVTRSWWRFFQQLGMTGAGVPTSKLFGPLVLTTGAVTLYTMPATPANAALSGGRVRFTNTGSGSHTVTAYAVPAGGAAGAANCFLNAEPIVANAHLDVDLPVLGAGGFIQAKADAGTAITVHQLAGGVSQ